MSRRSTQFRLAFPTETQSTKEKTLEEEFFNLRKLGFMRR
jgi:hypothetical protein|tara:strand:- start:633 stop:752 length:120 start_codon:yes stop_codon:yes gene_type:complete